MKNLDFRISNPYLPYKEIIYVITINIDPKSTNTEEPTKKFAIPLFLSQRIIPLIKMIAPNNGTEIQLVSFTGNTPLNPKTEIKITATAIVNTNAMPILSHLSQSCHKSLKLLMQ